MSLEQAPETTSPILRLVTTSVEELALTSVYWFSTGFDLAVGAINKCEVATISCGGEVSHYRAERFKLQ